MWMPRRPLRTTAGGSPASSMSAVLRPARALIPMRFNRAVMETPSIGRPGNAPGNSQGVLSVWPTTACPWRVRTSSGTRPARGSGISSGFLPSHSGQGRDASAGLAVEKNEAAGDPVRGGDGCVVEKAAAQVPSLIDFSEHFLAARGGVCGRCDVVGVSAADDPDEEVPDGVSAGFLGAQPLIDVALCACLQARPALSKPCEQADGGPDFVSHEVVAIAGYWAAPGEGAPPKTSQIEPRGERPDDLAFLGLLDLLHDAVDPFLKADQEFVTSASTPVDTRAARR